MAWGTFYALLVSPTTRLSDRDPPSKGDMADLLHSVGARLRQWFGNRRHPARRRVSIPCSVSVCEERDGRGRLRRTPTLSGNTLDLSATGLAFTLPAIRIGDRYIAGEDRTLRIILELPTGSVESYAIPTRYERIEERGAAISYIIGARITRIRESDRERFFNYLSSL